MDWPRFGRAFLQMERDSLRLLQAYPLLDRRYFAALEARYGEWLAELRADGALAPGIALLGMLWLGGVVCAWLLPPRWQALLVLVTAAWLARHGAVAARDAAASKGE